MPPSPSSLFVIFNNNKNICFGNSTFFYEIINTYIQSKGATSNHQTCLFLMHWISVTGTKQKINQTNEEEKNVSVTEKKTILFCYEQKLFLYIVSKRHFSKVNLKHYDCMQ